MGLIKAERTPPVLQFSLRDIEAQVQSLLETARQRGEKLVEEAAARAADLEEQARRQGFEQGLHEAHEIGRQQALEEHREQLQALLTTLSSAVAGIDNAAAEMRAALLHEAVELALAIAHRITKRVGMLDENVLLENVREAMKLIGRGTVGRISIHPSQRDTLVSAMSMLQNEWPGLSQAEVLGDESILPGGCRVFTAQGNIDADLQTQLDRITGKLLPGGARGGD